MAEIVWNKKARTQLLSIQEYITTKFGEKATKDFTKKLFLFLELLSKFPDLGTLEFSEKGVRGFLLHRNTRIFYKSVKDKIYILSVFDLRQNPDKV